MLSPYVLLVNARNRITKRENHLTGRFAESAHGNEVPPTSPDACRWCALGSIAAEAGLAALPEEVDGLFDTLNRFPETREAVSRLAGSMIELGLTDYTDYTDAGPLKPTTVVYSVNDGHFNLTAGGHEEVLLALDHAIDNMRSR